MAYMDGRENIRAINEKTVAATFAFALVALASPIYAQLGDTTNLWGKLTLDVCIATYETSSNEYLGITKCDHDLLFTACPFSILYLWTHSYI